MCIFQINHLKILTGNTRIEIRVFYRSDVILSCHALWCVYIYVA